ncbi:hypothetical protein DXG01_012868 [Tephrocybe rancida]|nr:hypothetical protein DXG01_012868 [Tephrocybe rancida]
MEVGSPLNFSQFAAAHLLAVRGTTHLHLNCGQTPSHGALIAALSSASPEEQSSVRLHQDDVAQAPGKRPSRLDSSPGPRAGADALVQEDDPDTFLQVPDIGVFHDCTARFIDTVKLRKATSLDTLLQKSILKTLVQNDMERATCCAQQQWARNLTRLSLADIPHSQHLCPIHPHLGGMNWRTT